MWKLKYTYPLQFKVILLAPLARRICRNRKIIMNSKDNQHVSRSPKTNIVLAWQHFKLPPQAAWCNGVLPAPATTYFYFSLKDDPGFLLTIYYPEIKTNLSDPWMFHNEMLQLRHLHEGQVTAERNQNIHSKQPYEEQWYHHLQPYLQIWTVHCTGIE